MKKISAILLAIVMVMAFATVSMAGWDKCKACHKETGDPMKIAEKSVSTKAELLKKFKTADALVKAAKDSTNPMMNAFKDDAMLKAAAKDLKLK